MSREDLAQVLGQLPVGSHPNLIVGSETYDDAAVYKLTKELAMVQTVDLITPVVDDPYSWGLIVGANSISDIYAMGARPVMALNIICFPSKTLPMSVLGEILRGGMDKATEAEIVIAGGHTIDDKEPKYGMIVTGLVHPEKVVRNSTARVGDRLILTKPLGIGVITTALKAGKVSQKTVDEAVEVMATLNKAAWEAMLEVGVNACTDVTGFGLLGHLNEMTSSSKVGARLILKEIPILEEAWALAEERIVPGGSFANLNSVKSIVLWHPQMTDEAKILLADAQTSGGLLLSVEEGKARALKDALLKRKVMAAEIGEIVEDSEGRIRVEP